MHAYLFVFFLSRQTPVFHELRRHQPKQGARAAVRPPHRRVRGQGAVQTVASGGLTPMLSAVHGIRHARGRAALRKLCMPTGLQRFPTRNIAQL